MSKLSDTGCQTNITPGPAVTCLYVTKDVVHREVGVVPLPVTHRSGKRKGGKEFKYGPSLQGLSVVFPSVRSLDRSSIPSLPMTSLLGLTHGDLLSFGASHRVALSLLGLSYQLLSTLVAALVNQRDQTSHPSPHHNPTYRSVFRMRCCR